MGNTSVVSRTRKDPSSQAVKGNNSSKGRRKGTPAVDTAPFVFVSSRVISPQDGDLSSKREFSGDGLVWESNPYKVFHLGNSFKPFIDKTVRPVSRASMFCHDLPIREQFVAHEEVIRRFGGFDKVETTIFDLYKELCLHADGECDDLLVNGDPNYFYMMNGIGVRVVGVERESTSGWRIYAENLIGRTQSPNMIERTCRVFTRGPITVSP